MNDLFFGLDNKNPYKDFFEQPKRLGKRVEPQLFPIFATATAINLVFMIVLAWGVPAVLSFQLIALMFIGFSFYYWKRYQTLINTLKEKELDIIELDEENRVLSNLMTWIDKNVLLKHGISIESRKKDDLKN